MTTQPAISVVRELIDSFVDRNSFFELDALAEHDCTYFGSERRKIPGDGIVTGFARINGRSVVLYAHDDSFLGGSSSRMHALKITKVLDLAIKTGVPVIGLNSSSGIRIHEGIDAGVQFAEVFYKTVKASGVIPQISILLGDCAGGAAYTPALTDFVIMVKDSSTMFLTGPTVIRQATGEEVTKEDIGSAMLHAKTTGLAHFVVNTPEEALSVARELLEFLPQNNCSPAPQRVAEERITARLSGIIPRDSNEPYDVTEVIGEIVDGANYLEVHHYYAPNIVTAFAHLCGIPIGIIANQPKTLAGCLDIAASEKAARFVRFCDAFNIPILTLIDVPGYLPGINQEAGGIIGAGAKLLHAYCESSVPKIAVVLRKAYGGAHPTLANKWATDMIFALPEAEIAIMGPQAAVDVIFRRQMADAEDPQARRAELVTEYRNAHASADYSARRGYINGFLDDQTIRPALANAFRILQDKIAVSPGRKHSNIQL
ncbi:acetyl-/propionyl-CoA carboxylase subunit beta [Xenorhabdus mauleonii]|uniref:Acetyl-/propionyl-CoA carboxylase subunit beta n=1 Tax=Xenorhabdus mauleonii TaxID=351675 RepID=A0A1I3PHZ2_9GAMM|nr:acyl-CoA carboxylase subunit beta [Xenorhabdus mauleonii]PHM44807.1 acetyl-/propionyl-CoA carboxylase subunit beta [Xenorhabdus mauleonii]SFJ20656.1 propionyl-CoA carboxylase beta chain [Xenorhabdus mauleonii]